MIWNRRGAHADKADGPDLVVHVPEHRVVGMAGVAGVVRGDPLILKMAAGIFTQVPGERPDSGQILDHLAPPVPQRIVRIIVERTLERPHVVSQVHSEKVLLDHGRRVMEGQQLGANRRSARRLPATVEVYCLFSTN